MASVGADGSEAIFLYKSVIRVHHIYKRIWTHTVTEILSVNFDPANRHNCFAIAVLKAVQLLAMCLEKSAEFSIFS